MPPLNEALRVYVMLYVTDTHPLLYFTTGKTRRLGKTARRIFEDAERGRAHVVVPITVLEEILRLQEKGTIHLTLPFHEFVARYQKGASSFAIQDYTPEILLAVFQFPAIRDPFDRVIVATASALDYPLITNDGFLRDGQFVPIVWE
jgi:PIN domain nuclease of toxin-antitoxin system